MTADIVAAELAAVADEPLWLTNPVWCINRLIHRWEQHAANRVHLPIWLGRLLEALPNQGIHLPCVAIEGWRNVTALRCRQTTLQLSCLVLERWGWLWTLSAVMRLLCRCARNLHVNGAWNQPSRSAHP